MKPVCTKCQRFFRPKTNGISFIEAMPTVALAPAGSSEPELWKPYKLWSGDLWVCLGCGAEIIVGVGQRPLAEHFQPTFEEELRVYKPSVTVNDC